MTSAVASTSQPAQIPALEGPHKDQPAQKKKEKKAKPDATSSHPLEVRRRVSSQRRCSPCLVASSTPSRTTSITVSKSLRS